MNKPEPVTVRDLKDKKVVPVCPQCGSSDVCIEAFARYSVEVQDWRLFKLLDGNCVCNHCGHGIVIKWKLT